MVYDFVGTRSSTSWSMRGAYSVGRWEEETVEPFLRRKERTGDPDKGERDFSMGMSWGQNCAWYWRQYPSNVPWEGNLWRVLDSKSYLWFRSLFVPMGKYRSLFFQDRLLKTSAVERRWTADPPLVRDPGWLCAHIHTERHVDWLPE